MKKSLLQFISGARLHLLIAIFLFGCNQEPILWEVKSNDQVISQFIISKSEFSEFAKLLELAKLSSLLSVRGPFTLFLPTDDAMKDYYALKGVTSYHGLGDTKFLKDFVMNHIVPSYISSGEIGLGAIRDTNALGDYLVTEFNETDIIVNKQCKIIDRDVLCSNGIIHIIDKAIDPVKINVFELLARNPDYSLFTEGLVRTKIKDTLQILDYPYGSKRKARTRYTILAIADSTYLRFGIKNIEQLISRYTDEPDNITSLDNGFYRYMEYHCIGGTYYLNNLETNLYPILSFDNNISVVIDNEDYKINLVKSTNEYTGFYIPQSNNPAKNGAVHTINKLLPVFEPEPIRIIWETTDFPEIREGDFFRKYYMRWFDGENTFVNIKWEGDYLLYYFRPDSEPAYNRHADCLSMSGWWWCQVTTPKIMKGKWRITGTIRYMQVNYAVYIDGEHTANINFADPADVTLWGIVDWPETKSHTFKVRALSPGMLFWDAIIFTPIL